MYGYNRIGPLTLEGLTQFLLLSAIQELEGGYQVKPSVDPPISPSLTKSHAFVSDTTYVHVQTNVPRTLLCSKAVL